jgi:hypothetical protein
MKSKSLNLKEGVSVKAKVIDKSWFYSDKARKTLSDVVEQISDNNREYTLTITEINPRSLIQNRYYFGVVVKMIANEMGDEPIIVHEILKAMFLEQVEMVKSKKTDTVVEVRWIKSSSELSTTEFEEYLEKCRKWAAEFLQLPIPLPNET